MDTVCAEWTLKLARGLEYWQQGGRASEDRSMNGVITEMSRTYLGGPAWEHVQEEMRNNIRQG